MSSDQDDSFNFADSDDGSDFEVAPKKPKAKAKSPASKPKAASSKPKETTTKAKTTTAATKKKATTTTAGASKSKKAAPLKSRDENAGDSGSEDEVRRPKTKALELDESDDEASFVRDEGDAMDVDEPAPGPKKGESKNASDKYQKLSQLEHILKRPDTYIGSVEAVDQPMWVYNEATKHMAYRRTKFVPGLLKIFDEILVNAADNKQNDANMDSIKVVIDRSKGQISVWNNGKGIPIEIHSKEKIYIPEMIFGHLLTSSNYDDDQKKVTGGRNGYGAKLANIYSTEFTVETADSSQKYKQTFKDHMGIKGKASITKNASGKEFTQITFKPDFKLFNMTEIDDDTEALLMKRVYDIAGTVKGVKVWLNGTRLTAVKNFKSYVEMFVNGTIETEKKIKGKGKGKDSGDTPLKKIDEEEEDKDDDGSEYGEDGERKPLVGADATGATKRVVIYERFSDRWEIAFAVSEEKQFQQVSFVNSIATTKGGTHVDYIANQLVGGITEIVKKKNKAVPLKPFQIKQYIWVFINCLIENPSFDSQTKENMTLGVKKFGSKCEITPEFLKSVGKTSVIDNILDFARGKQDDMLKKTDGHKRSRISGIVKLEDANNAGTRNSRNCTLILTEGDSAKSLAMAGLSVVGRDNYGVFPLRGKLLNVREASGKTLTTNTEVQQIKQILGLQHNKEYTSIDSLRYGSLMIMTDQDHDGSHIKGLIINFLDYFFPSLLKIPGFLVEFITPIVKVTKGKQSISFYTLPEYETWKETNDERAWKAKYYKGLGTSTSADAKDYFGNLRKHRLPFKGSTKTDSELIDLAFNKKKADDRKEWLRNFVPGTFFDHNVTEVPICDFINKELILFSMADNIRSIPSVIDGFKPGQRKVLFASFKKKIKDEIKVAQLSGYISEHTEYRHGEVSLQGTIVNMAQDYVGSNNINFMMPKGQFGTRLQGGKDHASARYIFTSISPITRTVFHPADDAIMNYLNEEGHDIEPEWYMPVLPTLLVNGSDGIGTGWSSQILNYNPADIIDNVRRLMNGEEIVQMMPWFRGFKGSIEKIGADKYRCSGVVNRISEDVVEITELPVRSWTQPYKEFLEGLQDQNDKQPPLLKNVRNLSTHSTVQFIVDLTADGKAAIEKEGIEKVFKTQTQLSSSNMVCFDSQGKIKKYNTPEDILQEFYDIRLTYYQKRKEAQINELTLQHERLSNQARFILMIVKRELVISNRKRVDIIAELKKLGFKPFPKKAKVQNAADPSDNENEEEVDPKEAGDKGTSGHYDYLLSMALWNLTEEKVNKLLKERDDKEAEINILLGKSPKDLWNTDLDAVQAQWTSLLEQDELASLESVKKVGKGKGRAKPSPKKTTKKKANDYESDVSDDYKPKKAAAASKPKAAASKAKAKDEDGDDEVKPKPVKKAPAKKRASDQMDDVDEAKPVNASKAAKKSDVIDLASDDDVFVVSKKAGAVASKPANAGVSKAKAKKVVDSEDEAMMESEPKPSSKPLRGARGVAKKSAYIELDDDEEDAFDDSKDGMSDFIVEDEDDD